MLRSAPDRRRKRLLPEQLGGWWREWGPALRTGLAAAAAWVITVAPVATGRQSGFVDDALAAACLLAGLCAPVFSRSRPVLARHVGLTAFVALAAASWSVASVLRGSAALDGYRAMLGAAAWALYALSWSHGCPPGLGRPGPAADPEPLSPLAPRRRLAVGVYAIVGVGVLGAAACLALAWRVSDPHRSVLAQMVAVVAAVGLLAASSAVALYAGRSDEAPSGRLNGPPALVRSLGRSIVALVAAAVVVVALALGRC